MVPQKTPLFSADAGTAPVDHWRKTIGSCFQRSGLHIFLISLTSLYYLLNAPILLGHYDLGWHLAAGDLIRQQGRIPFQDPWSFTAAGRQWFNLSWLWDAFASALYQHAGFRGLILLVVACGAAIVGYLTSLCRGSGASVMGACVAVLSACVLYPAYAAFPNIYLTVSPNMTTMLFAVIFFGECLKRTRRILCLPALMLLWANLHGGFLLGLLIIGIFGGVALLRRDWAHFKIYFVVGAACFIATLVNPLGWRIYEGLTTVLGHFSQQYITEWWPYYRNITIPGSIPGMVYIAAFIALDLRYRRSGPAEPRLISWLFLFLGLYQFRYMAFFYLFSAVPFALHLDRLVGRRSNDLEMARSFLIAGIVAACALPLMYLRLDPALGLPEMLSKEDVRYLETHFPHARLLNHWNFGGILLFYDRGAIPVFVDGRASTAYPDALLHDYFKLGQVTVDEAAWDTVLEKYHIDTVLWVRAHEQLRQFLVGKRGWKEAYTGMYASIYVKP